MTGFLRFVAGGLLIAHGLVHLLYVVDDVPEFTFERSWVVPDSVGRGVGIVVMVVTIVGFVLVGLAVWGVPVLSRAWPALTIVASVVSLVLMVMFWHSQVVFGILINVVLIAVAVLRPGWTDRIA